jgi:beta-N-acetylhexosaminidase
VKKSLFGSRLLCLPLIGLLAVTPMHAAAPVHLDAKGEKWAEKTLKKMSLEEKIGQLIMPWARVEFMNQDSPEYKALREEMTKYHVGGFGVTVFVEGSSLMLSAPLEAAQLTNGLQKDSKYPLLFAADFERGLSVRLKGATEFPSAMAFGAAGDPELAEEFGRISADEARAVGIQWNWFPVADVNSNPANPIINTRSFGGDPEKVGELLTAYIQGARSEGLLTTVKHFPGHGDTDVDSHLTLARVNASMDRLNALELVPFRIAIAAGVDSVMTAHVTVPAIEPDPNVPASVSANVVTGVLRDKLGFKGLVVTDALDMGALMQAFSGTPAEISGKEAVAAIKAGNDMVIIPADLGGAYDGLLNAVKSGALSQARIDESVLKILKIKASVGLDRDRFVDMNAVQAIVGKAESLAEGQKISDRAVTLIEDKNTLLPIHEKTGIAVVVFADAARTSEGTRTIVREIRAHDANADVYYVDETNAGYIAADVMAAVGKAKTVIAVAESVPSARRVTRGKAGGSSGLDESASDLLAEIVKADAAKTIVAAFGSPYVGSSVPGIGTYICTFSNTATSANSLVKALFGEMPIGGKSPVKIPGLGERGAGLQRP